MNRHFIIIAGNSIIENLERVQSVDSGTFKSWGIKNFDGSLERFRIFLDTLKQEQLFKDELFQNIDINNKSSKPNPINTNWILNKPYQNMNMDHPLSGSAEIFSLLHSKPEISENDKFTFLHSDTNEGLFSALVNAYFLAKGNVERIAVYNQNSKKFESGKINWNPEEFNPKSLCIKKFPKVCINLQRIHSLNPSDKQKFERQGAVNLMRAINYLVRQELSLQGRKQLTHEPVIVYTAGFKAALPLISWGVSLIAGTVQKTIKMAALFEGNSELIDFQVIPTTVDEEIKDEIDKIKVGGKPYEKLASIEAKFRFLYMKNQKSEIVLNWLGNSLYHILES